MALDVGNVRIGVAASDPTQTISTPLNSLTRKNSIPEIKEICSDRGIVLILVGMPYLPSGKLGTQAQITEAFINELKIYFSQKIKLNKNIFLLNDNLLTNSKINKKIYLTEIESKLVNLLIKNSHVHKDQINRIVLGHKTKIDS